jgi:outer membrane protein assembly factor BamB
MNPRSNEQRDADELDAFWDALVLDQNSRRAGTPEEEMVLTLQNTMALDNPSADGAADSRLRRLVFGSAPEAAAVTALAPALPKPKSEPIRPSWSIRKYTQLVATALAVILVGAIVAAQNAGFFGSRGDTDTPTAIPAAIAQLDATPATLASPTMSIDAILWTLPFEGTNVEIGATTRAEGTLYRLIRSDEFTGVQAVDTTTGTERWRSEQEWTGNGLGVTGEMVVFLTGTLATAIQQADGAPAWTTDPFDFKPASLTANATQVYIWDGISRMAAIGTVDGTLDWESDAGLAVADESTAASQPPVTTENGIAAISAAGLVALFDATGNATGAIGQFEPETVALAETQSGEVVFAGVVEQDHLPTPMPWGRKITAANPADGSIVWQTDYNALVTGLAVTDTMALVLADNPGLAVREVQMVDPEGTVTTEETNPYPEQTSPQIYGYDLSTGQMHFDMDESTGTGHGWVTDSGSSPYIAIEIGPSGPIAVSKSGQLSFFGTENPLVQAVASLPSLLPNQITADETAVYASQDDGTLTALAPVLGNVEPQPVSPIDTIDWSAPLDGQLVDFGGMAYSEGLVFRLIDTGAGPQIEATFAATGQPAWTLPFTWSTDQLVADPGPDPYDPAQTWTGSGNIFAVDAENRLIAIDSATGELAWQHAFADPIVSMIHDAGILYVWDESGTMSALLPHDVKVLWSTSAGSASGPQSDELGMPVPAMTRTTIAMVDAEGTLHAFSKETGELLWATPGFDGTNTRIVRQGDAEWDQTEVFVVVSAHGEAAEDGTFEQNVTGVLAATGERIWDNWMQGPLVQPVNTDETLVVVTANQLQTGKNVPVDGTPVVDAESYNHYVWTGTGAAAPDGGGERLFALQADTGEIVWIRTTAAGGFTDLFTKFLTGGGTLYAVTSDGLLVSPSRGNGSIGGEPSALGGSVLAATSSGETGAIGSFATLSDGTLVAFGGIPFSQQG